MSETDPHQYKDRYMLRLPDGMRDRLKAASKANGRSMNAEVVAALEMWLNLPTKEEQRDDLIRKRDMLEGELHALHSHLQETRARLDDLNAKIAKDAAQGSSPSSDEGDWLIEDPTTGTGGFVVAAKSQKSDPADKPSKGRSIRESARRGLAPPDEGEKPKGRSIRRGLDPNSSED